MELLRGRTLQEIAENAPLLEADFLNVARQALEGLLAAHALGMLHRDIKPGNLMLVDLPSGAFQVKILDFGLAKIVAEPSLQTMDQTGGLLGSVYTMSPEQFEGRPLDVRSDLYSLGCVCYYALTGYYPFNGKNVPEVICAHLQRRMAPLKDLRPDLSPALCDWVGRMMATYPENRPGSASEALEQLNSLQYADQGAKRPAAKSLEAPSPEPPKKRWAGVAVAVGVIVICGVYFQSTHKSPPESAMASAPVRDEASLLAKAGQSVTVDGLILGVDSNGAGTIRYLNFEKAGGEMLKLAVDVGPSKDFSEERIAEFVGKKVRVSGVLTNLDGVPQIEIDSFSQIATL